MGPHQSSWIWRESYFCPTDAHIEERVCAYVPTPGINKRGGRLQRLAHERVCPVCVCDAAPNPPESTGCSAHQATAALPTSQPAPLRPLHCPIPETWGKNPRIIHILWGSAKCLQDGNASGYRSQGSSAATQGSHAWWSARCIRRGGFWERQPSFKDILHDSNNKWVNIPAHY